MRAWTFPLACSLLLGMASVASAQADEAAAPAEPAKAESASAPKEAESASSPEDAAAAEAEPGILEKYGRHVSNTFLAGVNGVITWPADPVMLAVRPTDEMRAMPGGVVTGPMVGFFAGTLQGVLRLVTGAFDVAFCPFSFFPMFSIEPRYKLIPGWEHAG